MAIAGWPHAAARTLILICLLDGGPPAPPRPRCSLPDADLHEPVLGGAAPEHAGAVESVRHLAGAGDGDEARESLVEALLDAVVDGLLQGQTLVLHDGGHVARERAADDGLALARARHGAGAARVGAGADERRVPDAAGHLVHEPARGRGRRAGPRRVHHRAPHRLRRVHADGQPVHDHPRLVHAAAVAVRRARQRAARVRPRQRDPVVELHARRRPYLVSQVTSGSILETRKDDRSGWCRRNEPGCCRPPWRASACRRCPP
jgi:hypothetical protein